MARRDPKHLAWVRRQPCCVPGCQRTQIESHHIRTAANSGTGLKPPDTATVPLCAVHHLQGHSLGWRTFQQAHGIDLTAIAAEYARLSGQEMP